MKPRSDDYLWDPQVPADPEIESLERTLRPRSSSALRLADRALPLSLTSTQKSTQKSTQISRMRRLTRIVVAAAAACTGIYLAHAYRLNWPDGSPWPATIAQADGAARPATLGVGERLITGNDETATLSAARIGTVVVAPNSVAQLKRTRQGQHRIELERGRLHAKIWAPPNHFGVTHGEMRFIDLGCEFDLHVEADGHGTLTVASGWVIYARHGDEVLVPEGYSLDFDTASARTPLRSDAATRFRDWALEIGVRLTANASVDDPRVIELMQALAAGARDEDYFTLMNLLVNHPSLAQGPLYPRLAKALKIDQLDPSHRARWIRGDTDAREDWWQRLPKQPKAWWLNWRDAF